MSTAGPMGHPRDEWANVATHGLGLLGALAATPILIVTAARRGGAGDVVGASVFGATMILMYLASTAFHTARAGRARELLRRLDHTAIYLLIAGTYTPFTLGVLRGGWGWTLFGLVWGAAAIGVTTKLAAGLGHRGLSTAMYVVMGWLVVIALHPLLTRMDSTGVAWLVAGGVAYTAGVAFYVSDQRPYHHALWHLFVLAGSTCHFFAVLGHARP